jgi:hypothetical protein
MSKDKMSEILNLEPLDDKSNGGNLPIQYHENKLVESDEQVDADLKYVRENLYDLISSGSTAIDQMMAIADQSQHPRAYEVLSNMIRQMVETNKDLLDMHEKKNKISTKKEEQSSTVNNNLFVGSTKDILELIQKSNEDD